MAKKSDSAKTDSAENLAESQGAQVVDQNEALIEYRLTGVNRGYVDPLRAQEPDVAPEPYVLPGLGVFNPPPPEESQRGFIAKPASDDLRANTMEEKEKMAEDSDGTVSVATGLADSTAAPAPVDNSGEREQNAVTGEDVKE